VTIFCDDNKKYLSTALTGKEPIRPGTDLSTKCPSICRLRLNSMMVVDPRTVTN
jgi:hypothetical protein